MYIFILVHYHIAWSTADLSGIQLNRCQGDWIEKHQPPSPVKHISNATEKMQAHDVLYANYILQGFDNKEQGCPSDFTWEGGGDIRLSVLCLNVL